MLKSPKTAIFLSVAISAFNAGSASANERFEQQRSVSDGSAYSTSDFIPAGMQGRPGPASIGVEYRASSSWLDQQLTISDGYSQPGAESESAFQGASLELDPNQSFAEQGSRISDGTTE